MHQLTPPLPTDAAYALGGEDGHLTVSLDNIRHISLDGTSATFGGGNHLGDVALYLWDNGKYCTCINSLSIGSFFPEATAVTRTER